MAVPGFTGARGPQEQRQPPRPDDAIQSLENLEWVGQEERTARLKKH